jgi:metallo-beta-lactamase class B
MRRLLVLVLIAISAQAQISSEEERRWNAPVEPFRILPQLYYVGAAEVASYLITTPKGHIVIDSGFPETAPMVVNNLVKVGIDIHEVKILLTTHAHYDHVGGMAYLKTATPGTLMVSEADAALMARGGAGDPQFGDRFRYPPVYADRTLRDGDRVSLGGVVLTAHITPGHTPGCTTWTLTLREKFKPYDVVIVCSASVPPGYKLLNNPNYPNAVDDYRRTFAVLKSLPCDVPLAPHPSFFDLMAKRGRGGAFIDPKGYQAYVARTEAAFEAELKRERNAH